eukprot:scaffold27675_cov85-Phaeocystis_antarctica.AAC.1
MQSRRNRTGPLAQTHFCYTPSVTKFACTVVRILFQLIAEYVIVEGSNDPCHPALRVGQWVNDCPSAAQVTLAAWPELSKPFCERRTPVHKTRDRP